MYSVTFNTIQPRSIRSSGDVVTRLEELERLAMTTPAHLERGWCVELGNEMTRVSFRLFGLRNVSTVTAIARYTNSAVSA